MFVQPVCALERVDVEGEFTQSGDIGARKFAARRENQTGIVKPQRLRTSIDFDFALAY